MFSIRKRIILREKNTKCFVHNSEETVLSLYLQCLHCFSNVSIKKNFPRINRSFQARTRLIVFNKNCASHPHELFIDLLPLFRSRENNQLVKD